MPLCINGLNRIPLSPLNVLGKIPKLVKSKPNLISNQNTSHIINTNAIGYAITPAENLNCSWFFTL